MVIVISSPQAVNDEAEIINNLFSEGMNIFHLRKPSDSIDKVEALLEGINPEYYPKISLHQYHEMASRYGIKRLHYNKKSRHIAKEEDLAHWKKDKYLLSTSVHSIKSYNALLEYFDYSFVGPIFDSISKTGYKSGFDKETDVLEDKGAIKMIAIGGVNFENMIRALEMGFDGVAVLGIIWQDPRNALTNFKRFHNYVH